MRQIQQCNFCWRFLLLSYTPTFWHCIAESFCAKVLQALKTSFSQLEEKTKLELQLLQSNPQFWNTALRDKLLRVSQLFSSQATDQIHFNDAESRWAYLGTYTAAHATLVQATFTSGRFEPLTEFIKNSHSKERSVVIKVKGEHYIILSTVKWIMHFIFLILIYWV